MTAVNPNEGAPLDGVETRSASPRTGSHRQSLPLRALSSYRLKRLSLKKRPGNAQPDKLLPSPCTAGSQAPRNLEASSRHPEGNAQGPPLSAAVHQEPFRNELSSSEAPEPCLKSSAGKLDLGDAAKVSESYPAKATGPSGAAESLPMPTAGLLRASVSGRPPLQAWVPRKRNLASFDALDELSFLTSQKQRPAGAQVLCLPALTQSGPSQQRSTGLPFKAPTCLPGSQEQALRRAHPPSRMTVPPAGFPAEDLEGPAGPHSRNAQEDGGQPCSSAAGADLAAGSQLAGRAGASALMRRLHSKPFAAPRPIQKPEAQAEASERPRESSLASFACHPDTELVLEGSSAAMHHTSQLHPGTGRDDSHAVSSQPVGCLGIDGVISDSEAGEGSDTGPERQTSGSDLADVAPVDASCSVGPLKLPSHTANSSREPRQLSLPSRQAALGETGGDVHSEQPLPAAKRPGFDLTATASPAYAAATRVTAPSGKSAQSAGRKTLKRLYTSSDDAHMPLHAEGPAQNLEGEDMDVLASMEDLSGQSLAHMDHKDEGDESPSEGTGSLDALTSSEDSPAPQLQAPGRSLKRLRRITDGSPEAAAVRGSCHPESNGKADIESNYPKAAVQGAPRANPFASAKAAVPQEPRLACHAAPAQPQCNALGDDVSLGDMHALLRGPGVQHQAGRPIDTSSRAIAGGVIDLASDDSSGGGDDCAAPPARPKQRRICLPGMPSSPGHRLSQGRQPGTRSYLGAYSSADIMPEPTQASKAQSIHQDPASARGDASPDRVWRESAPDCSRHEEAYGALSKASFGSGPGSLQQDALLGDPQDRQPQVRAAQQYRAQSSLGIPAPVEGAHPDVHCETAGTSRQPRDGSPWWHRLEDFVPVAALRDGRDPRDGSRVFVDYRAQFSGEKHPTAAGGGFQQAKRGRKAQRDAPPTRAAEAAHAQGSSMGHWMTTHVQGRRRKVYVTAGGRKQLTGAAAHTAYERDKHAAGLGSSAKD